MTTDTHRGLIRLRTYTVDEVFSLIMTHQGIQKKITLDGIQVKASSRILTFFHKGITCVECGVTGVFFAVERWPHNGNNTWHINLYGYTDRHEVLMTKDHIVPKSKGGKDTLNNLQPMCKRCNERKDNAEPEKNITARKPQRCPNSQTHIRHTIVPINEVINWMSRKGQMRGNNWRGELRGVEVNITNRDRVFLRFGRKCKDCGIEGQYYAIERAAHVRRWHLVLYTVRNYQEVLMTVDHIVPLAKGGPRRSLSNLQPMCHRCNNAKSDGRSPNGATQWD